MSSAAMPMTATLGVFPFTGTLVLMQCEAGSSEFSL
jgi:hypothetical protein